MIFGAATPSAQETLLRGVRSAVSNAWQYSSYGTSTSIHSAGKRVASSDMIMLGAESPTLYLMSDRTSCPSLWKEQERCMCWCNPGHLVLETESASVSFLLPVLTLFAWLQCPTLITSPETYTANDSVSSAHVSCRCVCVRLRSSEKM